MKTLPTSLTLSCLYFFIVFISVSWLGLSSLEAQTFNNTSTESPVEFSPFYAGGIDLGHDNHGHPLIKGRGNYMVFLDTVKVFNPRDEELALDRLFVYEFTKNHQIAKRDFHFYQSSFDEIQPFSSVHLTYDSEGVVIADTTYSYSVSDEVWIPSNYRVFDYNQEGIWIGTTRWDWVQSSEEWRPFSLFEREIENGLRIKESTFNWNQFNQEYELGTYSTWEYEEELLIHELNYRMDQSADTFWVHTGYYHEYNDDQLLSARETYNRQNFDAELRPGSRVESFYNDDNLLNLQYFYIPLQPFINEVEWVPSRRTETSYTDFGKTDIILVSTWDEAFETWEHFQRTRNTYDQYENLIDNRFSFANPANPDQWLLDRHSEYEYDYNFESGTYLTDQSQVDASGHLLSKLTISRSNPTRLGSRTELIYSEITVNTDNLQEEDGFQLFPNPVKDMLSIRLEKATDQKITIVDITGRILYRNHFSGSLDISTDQWPAGIYSVVLQDLSGAAVISRQFVKQ